MACLKLRELHDVLRCRPRGRDALGGTVSKSIAFLRVVLFGGDFDH